jgi:hypothetical protein
MFVCTAAATRFIGGGGGWASTRQVPTQLPRCGRHEPRPRLNEGCDIGIEIRVASAKFTTCVAVLLATRYMAGLLAAVHAAVHAAEVGGMVGVLVVVAAPVRVAALLDRSAPLSVNRAPNNGSFNDGLRYMILQPECTTHG